MRVKTEVITPEIAAALLATNPVKNRSRFKIKIAKRYAAEISKGNWEQNGESIKIGSDGVLVDGQHRLTAVVIANTPIVTLVVRDLPPETFDTIDTGFARNAAQVLSMRGEKYAYPLAAAAKWLRALLISNTVSQLHGIANEKAPIRDISETLEAHPLLHKFAEIHSNVHALKRILPSAALAPIVLAAEKYGEQRAIEFTDLLATGVDLKAKDPVHVLRERIIANRMATAKLPAAVIVYFVFRAVAAHMRGESLAVMRISKDAVLPIL